MAGLRRLYLRKFNQSGEVVLNQTGQVPFEKIDHSLRLVFNLLLRTESPELKRCAFDEFSSELSNWVRESFPLVHIYPQLGKQLG